MTLLEYRIFHTVTQQGSFARAAQILHLTPSAISHAVSSMEESCGFSLFVRGKGGVSLTRSGEALYPFIRQVLSADEALSQTIGELNGVQRGTAGKQDTIEGTVRAALPGWLEVLKPGGALIFDVSTPEKLSGTLGNHTLFSDEDEIAYIWQNSYDEKTALVQLNLSIFVRRPDGAYDRLEEQQVQRAHSKEELTKWLTEAGFENIRFFGRQRMTAPRAGDERWHILAIKPADGGK